MVLLKRTIFLSDGFPSRMVRQPGTPTLSAGGDGDAMGQVCVCGQNMGLVCEKKQQYMGVYYGLWL